jgi:hypothetical protein
MIKIWRGPRAMIISKSAVVAPGLVSQEPSIHFRQLEYPQNAPFSLFSPVLKVENRHFTILGRVWQSLSNFYITGLICDGKPRIWISYLSLPTELIDRLPDGGPTKREPAAAERASFH